MIYLIAIATVSVSLRALCGIIDRQNFGPRRLPIVGINLLNNAVPFVFIAFPLIATGGGRTLLAAIANPRLLVFGGSVQIVAFAFSYGFRHYTVPTVNLVARIGDALIPFALYVIGARVTAMDVLFALSVSACVLLAVPPERGLARGLAVVGLGITAAVLLQSVTAEYVFSGSTREIAATMAGLAALLFWRGAFCLPLLPFGVVHLPKAATDEPRPTGRMTLAVIGRAVATIVHHAAFVYALARGNRVVMWPILNSVPIFAAVLSTVLIRERPTRREAASLGIWLVATCLRSAAG